MKKLRLVAWFINNKTPQVVFQGPVNHFSLAVTLGMVCRASAKFSLVEFEKGFPKLADEDTVLITYN